MPVAQVERRDSVTVVWLDEPGEKVNKISLDLVEEFSLILDGIEKDPGVKAVVTAKDVVDFPLDGDDRLLWLNANCFEQEVLCYLAPPASAERRRASTAATRGASSA